MYKDDARPGILMAIAKVFIYYWLLCVFSVMKAFQYWHEITSYYLLSNLTESAGMHCLVVVI